MACAEGEPVEVELGDACVPAHVWEREVGVPVVPHGKAADLWEEKWEKLNNSLQVCDVIKASCDAQLCQQQAGLAKPCKER